MANDERSKQLTHLPTMDPALVTDETMTKPNPSPSFRVRATSKRFLVGPDIVFRCKELSVKINITNVSICPCCFQQITFSRRFSKPAVLKMVVHGTAPVSGHRFVCS